MFGRVKRIHLVGIGGTGMCGIAEVLLGLGFRVTGSDRVRSDVTERLASLGARIAYDHNGPLVLDSQVVVTSTAISPENQEVNAARAMGIPVIRRAEMLAELMRMKRGVAIGGSHGKTTTTSMAGAVLTEGGLDPTVVVGGRVRRFGSNARVGSGDYLVAEADESDGTFLKLAPTIALITNIDREHVDFYASLADTCDAFVHFANRVPFYGAVVLCLDDPNVQAIIPRLKRRFVTYGIESGAELQACGVTPCAGGSEFELVHRGVSLGRCRLRVPGRHNVANALAAALVGLELEIPADQVIQGLESFDGVGRRLERRGEVRGVVVYDDYAHHPREIEATLRAIREHWDGRVIAAFQPHRYSRVEVLQEDFGRAFYGADVVLISDVYAAGEEPRPGIDAELIASRCRAHGHRDVHAHGPVETLPGALAKLARPGDLVITLGAGSIGRVGPKLLEEMRITIPSGVGATAVHRGRKPVDLVGDLEGEQLSGHSLARCTSLRLGGPAEVVFRPATSAAAAEAVARSREAGIAFTIMGGGTNLLVADRGLPGIAIILGPSFRRLQVERSGHVHCGAAVPLARLMRTTLRAGLKGLESAAGIPGSVGGAVVMNAGTFEGEFGDHVAAVKGVDSDGRLVEVEGRELGFSYRHSRVRELGLTLLEVELALEFDEAGTAPALAQEIRDYRNRTQPHRVRSAGSVFKNPEGDAAGRLIDLAGLKGTRVGGAEVSRVHANYLVAGDGSSAADFVNLIDLCRARVFDQFGVSLELEVHPLGFEEGELEASWNPGLAGRQPKGIADTEISDSQEADS